MAKVTSKGQITIPVSIRRRLGINEGDKILFIDSPDGVVMVNPDMLQGGKGAVNSEFGIRNSEFDGGEKPDLPPMSAPAAVAEPPEDIAPIDAAPHEERVVATGAAVEAEPAPVATVADNAVPTDIASNVAASIADMAPTAEPKKTASNAYGFDLGSLLDEIRSIGSKGSNI